MKVKEAQSLTGQGLRRLVGAATRALEANAEAVNALNVFPVPDGDTGTNMLLTLRAITDEAERCPEGRVDCVAQAIARGALLGARGNSGVILSQFFRGLARGLTGLARARPRDLARAMVEAASSAYKAVSHPVEGTMLTVIRSAAEGAMQASDHRPLTLTRLLEGALASAQRALQETPSLLPVLREAGVVDAGGQGFVVMLEGMLRHLRGEDPAGLTLESAPADFRRVSTAYLASTREEHYGFCTQFIVQGRGLDPDLVRSHLATMADSTVVVGDEAMLKVHIHTRDPEPALRYGATLGAVSQVKVENIDQQHQEFLRAHGQEEALVGVVAVAWGRGIEAVFHNMGATVVKGGPTMNPSTRDLLSAVEATAARQVIILPNNPNIIPVAQQVAQVTSRQVRVLPTRSIPQGVSALLAFNPDADLERNLQAMRSALSAVRSGEVTVSIRDARLDGVRVRRGQFIGLLDGRLVAVARNALEALLALLQQARPQEGCLVTLYWGEPLSEEEARRAGQAVRHRFPGVEVEVVFGGQPFYHFLVSLE